MVWGLQHSPSVVPEPSPEGSGVFVIRQKPVMAPRKSGASSSFRPLLLLAPHHEETETHRGSIIQDKGHTAFGGDSSHLTQSLHFTIEKTEVYKGTIVSQILTEAGKKKKKLSMKLTSDEARRALSPGSQK